VALVALVAAGTWAGMNATELKALFAARQFRGAAADAERAAAADRLAALGDPGLARLLDFTRSGNESWRAAAVAGLDRHITALGEGDPRAGHAAAALLDAVATLDPAGQRAVLELMPTVLKKAGPEYAPRFRAVVATGLKSGDPGVRVVATRLALHPAANLRPDLLPLLAAPEAEVRQAALFAAAVAGAGEGEPLLADEELFRWLHDPDEGVRRVCREALVGRDRSESEIGLGRRLVDPDPLERLKLLLDLRYDDDVSDPEPWLERLSRDPEPAVRAGAARVAVEVAAERRLPRPAWVNRVADADADATVRRVARFFRGQPAGRFDPHVQPLVGP
jgi:hypothetical protein